MDNIKEQDNWVTAVIAGVVALVPVVIEAFESEPGTPEYYRGWATLHAGVIKDAMQGMSREKLAAKYRPILPFKDEGTKNKWVKETINDPEKLSDLVEKHFYWFNDNMIKAGEPIYEFENLVKDFNIKPTQQAAAETGINTLPASMASGVFGNIGIVIAVIIVGVLGYILFFKK